MTRIKEFLAELGWAFVYVVQGAIENIRKDWKPLLALSAAYLVCVGVVMLLWPKP